MSVSDLRGGGTVPPGRRPFSMSKRAWGALAGAFALATSLSITAISFADNASGCDFSSANNGIGDCSGPLSGSTFAGGDGNLSTSPTTYGTTDWQNVGSLNTGIDKPSGTGDNSFGQGTKEDNANVSVVSGSIPPNKSDLTRFYEASEFANGSNFLYLAWERTNNLGSANMDFEINQKAQPDLTTTGAKTLNRTAGDLLVTFDFNNGGGKPTIGLLRWVTSGATSQCFSSNALPCWGNEVTLDGTEAIGAVNNLGSVTDPFVSNSPNNIGALRFGETAINLTAAGVFPAGTCTAFGSAFLKSRSSASFPAEVKDFVAPVPVNISNCGTVNIVKNTDPRNVDQNFGYTSTIPNPSDPTADPRTPQCTSDATPSAFTLNDKTGGVNTEHCVNVPVGSYTVLEGAEPANFVLKSLTCTVDGTGGSTGAQDPTNPMQANIELKPSDTVTCTYVNKQQLGAIKITKVGKNKAAGSGDQPLSGAKFSITGPGSYSTTVTTGTDGTACVDGLGFGDYTVTETAAPSGYAIDTKTGQTVTVDTNATCSDATYVGEAKTFTDTPLTDILAKATSQKAGATNSKITCVDSGNNTVASSGSDFVDPATASATGLAPGTYTCTIIIDP